VILREYTIEKNDAGQRLDRFLTKQGLTIGVIRKALRNKDIKINGKREQADCKLIEGDILRVYLKSDIPQPQPQKAKFHGVSTNLNIIYEDENILLVDKPAGLLCHEDNFNNQDTLINRIKSYLYKKGEFFLVKTTDNCQLSIVNCFVPSLCNRIDRNTAGIVIAAKNAESLRVMNEKIKQRQVTKLYLCILAGVPKQKEATLTAFLEKDEVANTVKISAKKTANSKTIITKYRILDERGGLALAEINLLTGRTHQIRAHMAYIGCPLLGDGKYGRNKINKKYGFSKQALCSYKLAFDPAEENNHLDYLDSRQFEVGRVWFLDKYYGF